MKDLAILYSMIGEANIKDQLIVWLSTKSVSDIVYVKKNPEISIFLKHPELTPYDIELIVHEPQRIVSVKQARDHENRLLAIRTYSRNLYLQYILLNPFSHSLPERLKGKVAIVTAYPIRKKQP